MRRIAAFTPTTHGMPNSRAMIAPCDNMPPRSITSPEMSGNTGPQPGSVCFVTSTSPRCEQRRLRHVRSSTVARPVTRPPHALVPAGRRPARRRRVTRVDWLADLVVEILALRQRERIRRCRRRQTRVLGPVASRLSDRTEPGNIAAPPVSSMSSCHVRKNTSSRSAMVPRRTSSAPIASAMRRHRL